MIENAKVLRDARYYVFTFTIAEQNYIIKRLKQLIYPQIVKSFYSITPRTFELIIRTTAILEFLRTWGIGVLIDTRTLTLQYRQVTLMILASL